MKQKHTETIAPSTRQDMLRGGGDDVILGCGGEIGGNAEVV